MLRPLWLFAAAASAFTGSGIVAKGTFRTGPVAFIDGVGGSDFTVYIVCVCGCVGVCVWVGGRGKMGRYIKRLTLGCLWQWSGGGPRCQSLKRRRNVG